MWLKKKRVFKPLFFSFCKNVKRATIRKNSQENLGTEGLGKGKNLNIK